MAPSGNPPHVELRGVSKHFGGVRAVKDVDLDVAAGTVHAIVGENGAGKSTVAKMIAGELAPSEGQIAVHGQPVSFRSPRQALAAGITAIDQELALVPSRSVIDNLFLGAESRNLGVLTGRREERRRFRELIERTGFELPPDVPVGALSIAQQQEAEILRALVRKASFIVMDEPTAPLTKVESERLYEVIAELKAQGTTILYISHFLAEVLRVADTITVMRDGRHVSTNPAAEETESSLVRAMLGRSIELTFPERQPFDQTAEPLFEVEGLRARGGRLQDISFELRPGEILGFAGLIGSGRSELLRALFGADHIEAGEVRLAGQPMRFAKPSQALDHGLMLLPESRKDDGLVMGCSIAENMMLPHLDLVSCYGLVGRRRARARVRPMMEELDIRAGGPEASVETLSGGNQQKVLFGKCLMVAPRVLLVDEPTRGVDVGAKRAIYELIVSLAGEGMALVVVSSELEEVLGLSHRVMVMRGGRIVAEMKSEQADQESVLSAAFGAA